MKPGINRRMFLKYSNLAGLTILGCGASIHKAFAAVREQASLRFPVANVRGFGARGDGVHDDTEEIQAAIDSLPENGGTVFFPPGTYLISRTPHKSWCLLLRSNIHYVGAGQLSTLLLAPGQAESDRFLRMLATSGATTSRNITLRHLNFDGNRDNQIPSFCHANPDDPGCNLEQLHAVFLVQVEDCRILQCKFYNIAGDAIYIHEGGFSEGSQRIRVTHNEMFWLGRVGVNFAGASNSVASNNYIHDTNNNALKIEQDPGATTQLSNNRFLRNIVHNAGGIGLSSAVSRENVRDMLIWDNRIVHTPGAAISMSEVSNIEVRGNTIIRAQGGAISVRSAQEVMISANKIRETVGGRFDAAIMVFSEISGGTLPASQGISVKGNRIQNNSLPGIWLRHAMDGVIQANSILNNSDSGIHLSTPETQNTLVQGNIIKDNTGQGILVFNGAQDNHFRRNKIIANKSGGILLLGSGERAGSDNEFGIPAEHGLNCIEDNTLFGLSNETEVPIWAVGNFWGCPEGPVHPDPGCSGSPDCNNVEGLVEVCPVLSECPE